MSGRWFGVKEVFLEFATFFAIAFFATPEKLVGKSDLLQVLVVGLELPISTPVQVIIITTLSALVVILLFASVVPVILGLIIKTQDRWEQIRSA